MNYYDDGYTAGACDRVLGYRSIIASTCPDHCLPGYAQGYNDGYNSQVPYQLFNIHSENTQEAQNVSVTVRL